MCRCRLIFAAFCLFIPLISSAQMKHGEVTVQYKTDSTGYSAILNKAGWKSPKTITLCSNDALDTLPVNHTLYDEANAIKAYDCLIKPLVPYIRKGCKIYYNSAGRIHFINLDALVDSKGKRLFETYHFYRVSDIGKRSEDDLEKGFLFKVLYGGMNYEADTEEMNAYGWPYHTPDRRDLYNDIPIEGVDRINLGTAEDGTRAGISTLRSSKEEIKYIYRLSGCFTSVRTGGTALEECFRLEVQRRDDYILHISTHSFNAGSTGGLLFTGAAHTLNGERMPYGLNDGLLSMEEIVTLDLSHCKLAVLAACNTALGTVTQDGIVGLQSAFKKAGVQSILMTLWSVNDRATAEFMKIFYDYLYAGKSKREALDRARTDMMCSSDFNNPVYWASMILLD